MGFDSCVSLLFVTTLFVRIMRNTKKAVNRKSTVPMTPNKVKIAMFMEWVWTASGSP
jgi:hypothetical protein